MVASGACQVVRECFVMKEFLPHGQTRLSMPDQERDLLSILEYKEARNPTHSYSSFSSSCSPSPSSIFRRRRLRQRRKPITVPSLRLPERHLLSLYTLGPYQCFGVGRYMWDAFKTGSRLGLAQVSVSVSFYNLSEWSTNTEPSLS